MPQYTHGKRAQVTQSQRAAGWSRRSHQHPLGDQIMKEYRVIYYNNHRGANCAIRVVARNRGRALRAATLRLVRQGIVFMSGRRPFIW